MRVYLDNNATTAVHPAVLAAVQEALGGVYGNASSIHKEGQTARRKIENAREQVAQLIGATAREIVFTSGGTESNNAAIFGAVPRSGRHHIVTTAIEHPSVAESVQELERRGHSVTVVAPARTGRLAAQQIVDALRPDTRLVAVMLANNETGVIQPVEEIASVCRGRGIHMHCDGVQAAGKIDVNVETLGVDTLAMSAHKLHAPKGIGALYVRKDLKLDTFIFGGAQERRRRAGTENVPLAIAFGVAAEIARERPDIGELRDHFEQHLGDMPITINGATVPRLPNTSSITFHGADAEGIVIGLDLNGIAASTGSACSSGRVEPSKILIAMGLSPDDARSTVRFSLSRFTTSEEIERAVEVVREIVPRTTRSTLFSGPNA
ncbi:MAG TPA: cysteine desulfurase family protein [Thermoanaerobaculia bacterium]|nr:cysteine desulfurase family protein [Thermoanaerobaculia bacterium]